MTRSAVPTAPLTIWNDTQPIPTGTAFGTIDLIQLQAQVTAGTGTIAAQQLSLSGVGS